MPLSPERWRALSPYLDEALDAFRPRAGDEAPGEFRVHAFESFATQFPDDADQVDNGVDAADSLMQFLVPPGISLVHFDRGPRDLGSAPGAGSDQETDSMPLGGELLADVLSDKTGSTCQEDMHTAGE